MKKPDQLQTIPKQVEAFLDSIHGEFRCIECKQVLDRGGEFGIKTNPNHSYSLDKAISQHICPAFKFSYDFSSPLTIAEQYAQARANRS